MESTSPWHVRLGKADISHLPAPQAALIDGWAHNVLDPEEKRGLWIFGPRQSGTSYAARAAIRRAMVVRPEVKEQTPRSLTAFQATEEVRKGWKLDQLLRDNGSDYGLWVDSTKQEEAWAELWECDLLWMDDLNPEAVDISFWRKRIYPPFEARLKQQKLTIVSTTYAPNSKEFASLEKVITNLYVVIPLPERDAER